MKKLIVNFKNVLLAIISCLLEIPKPISGIEPTVNGVYTSSLVTSLKKSVGGNTYTRWKDRKVVKAKSAFVTQPNTDPQLNQQGKMRTMVFFARKFMAAIMFGFKQYSSSMSEFNAFIKFNINSALTFVSTGVYTLDYANMLVSKGSMSPTNIDSLVATNASPTVNIAWLNPSLFPGQSNTDKAFALVLNKTQNNYVITDGTDIRTDLAITATLPSNAITGDHMQVYLFFANTTDRTESDSITQEVIV